MALRDVKKYYYTVLNQYIELKDDLKDFEQALTSGYITEDRLIEAKEYVEKVKENLDRLSYIMYLFELPNRKAKQKKFKAQNKILEQYFIDVNATDNDVILENKSTLTQLRSFLKTLK